MTPRARTVFLLGLTLSLLLTGCGKQPPPPPAPAPAATPSASPRATTPTLAVATSATSATTTALATTAATSATTTTPAAAATPGPPRPVLPPLPSPDPALLQPPRPQGLFRDAARRASVDTASAVAALGPDAVKAHQYLNDMTAPPDAERLHHALLWCRQRGWPDRGSTVTLVKVSIAANAENRQLVYKLAAAEGFAWPAPLDANTVVPNFVNMQSIGLLVLARARYEELSIDEALRDIKAVMLLGRRLQGPNATTLPALNGLELRGHALNMLGWLLIHRQAQLRHPGELAQFIAREQESARGAIVRAWEHQLAAAEAFTGKCFALLQSDLRREPELKKQLRSELAERNALPNKPIDDTELLDFISTRTLRKFYRRYHEEGIAFSKRPIAWRTNHRGEYEASVKDIYTPWARRLDPFPVGSLDELLLQEDIVDAQARLLVTACLTLEHARENKPLKKAEDYVTSAGLAVGYATEPFTEKPFKLETVRRGQVRIRGAERTPLIMAGLPEPVVARYWLNNAKPITLELR